MSPELKYLMSLIWVGRIEFVNEHQSIQVRVAENKTRENIT